MFWACHELGVNYMPKLCIKWVQSVSGHHPSFFGNKMDLSGLGQKWEKKKQAVQVYAHTVLGVAKGKSHIRHIKYSKKMLHLPSQISFFFGEIFL